MKRFIWDMDTAGDDAFAILLLALAAGARLEAVTTVAGNLPLERVTEDALYTLQLAGWRRFPSTRGPTDRCCGHWSPPRPFMEPMGWVTRISCPLRVARRPNTPSTPWFA